MQLLLIQTQVMKVDMESALLQMDQVMRANRLNFSLMAGMPALLAGFMSTSLGSTSLGESFQSFFAILNDSDFYAFQFQAFALIDGALKIAKTCACFLPKPSAPSLSCNTATTKASRVECYCML